MARKKTVKEAEAPHGEVICPICLAAKCLRDAVGRDSAFFHHMNNSRIEFLEGVKSLIDAKIDAIKKESQAKTSKLTKIKVED